MVTGCAIDQPVAAPERLGCYCDSIYLQPIDKIDWPPKVVLSDYDICTFDIFQVFSINLHLFDIWLFCMK